MDNLSISMEAQFKEKLLQFHMSEKKSVLISKDEYFALVEELKEAAKVTGTSKTWRQYYILKRYQILLCGDVEKIIRKKKDEGDEVIYFAHNDDIFDIIKRVHVSTGHGGRDKMMKVLSVKYANITREVLELYKSLCIECAKKRKRPAVKGVVVRPILSNDYGSRGQVDLIDMQSMPSGNQKWIMVYQDHLTKFCVLRPLSSKRAAEVAYQLVDIFLLIGAPHILQSDNGSEFTASVIAELKELWIDLLMVHGKPRHPQSQGSVERLNCDIKDMLIAWMGDNSSADWPVGLKFVQFMKNTSYHSTIKQTPFSALFGGNPRVGLRSTNLPTEILERLVTEDDLFAAFNLAQPEEVIAAPSTSAVQAEEITAAPSTSAVQAEEITVAPSTSAVQAEKIPAAPSTSAVQWEEVIAAPSTSAVQPEEITAAPSTSAVQPEEITAAPSTSAVQAEEIPAANLPHRKRAREGIVQQAERMLKRSRLEHAPGNPGDNVTIPIPLVDRGRGDPRNIMGVIIDRDSNNLYRIAVRGGMLQGKYARNQFDLCTQILLTREDVSEDSDIGLRRAVQLESKCGGQGFVKCNCSGAVRCSSNRCKCFKAKVKCNSRCHTSLACYNKM
jgi:hypothetical protein